MSDIKIKFINEPDRITPELLEGYVLAYPDQVKLGGENIVVRANPKDESKVAVVTLGGSGHEPALSGFVGEGMLDCSVVGDIFAAPGAQRLFQALQLMKREAGILLIVLNHSGDVMSANMACQLAERMGIKVKQILTHDDISAGIGADAGDRRGLAGCVPLAKILGAAAEMVDLLCQQIQPKAGDKMMLVINGVGATTYMEQSIIFRKAYKELEARGLQVVFGRIQEILTVQEQAGFQMIVAILDEDHIDYLKNKRADAPYWTTIGK